MHTGEEHVGLALDVVVFRRSDRLPSLTIAKKKKWPQKKAWIAAAAGGINETFIWQSKTPRGGVYICVQVSGSCGQLQAGR